MVRRKDRFWEYAEDLKGRFRCKFCLKDYPGGIARVKSHLSRLQGRDVAICNSVPDDVQTLALATVRGKDFPYKKRKTAMYSMDIEGNGADSSLSPSTSCPNSSLGLAQNSLLAICNKKEKELVDKMVAQAFIMNNIALCVIQSPSFITMVKAITEFGNGYTLPSYSTLCTKLIQDARKDVEEYVSTVQSSWSLTGCTLISDIWTDAKDCSFINVVSLSPKGAVFLKSFEKMGEGNIGELLGGILMSVIEEIEPENVVQIIVNNASDHECSEDLVRERFPHIYKTRCASQGVQLLLKDIYQDVEWIQNILNDSKLIVDYIYKHPPVLKLMRVQMGERELKRVSKSISVSQFLMLQSVLEAEDHLRSMVASPEWTDMDGHNTPTAESIAQIIRASGFWSQGREAISVLEPLIRVICLVEGEGSTAGYLYEAMERARMELMQLCVRDSLRYSKILELFVSTRDENIVHKIHAAAAFLNPSSMYDGKVKYEQPEIKEGMNYVVETMLGANEMDDFAADLLLYNGRSPKLFNTLSVLMMKKAHPRVWWEYNGGEVPLLRKVAIRILSQPCSSSACARSCSAFSAAQTKKINRLSPDILEDLVYTRMNSKLMAAYGDFEMRDKFSINLEKAGEPCDDVIEDGLEQFSNAEGTAETFDDDTLVSEDTLELRSSSQLTNALI